MILSYRNKATEKFASGAFVKAFSGFARQAETRLDRLDAASGLQDLAALPGDVAGRQVRAIQHPHQRPMANLLRVACWRIRAGQRRDHGLSLRIAAMTRTRTPIHPGEHLKEELDALGVSASDLARQIKVPPNRVTAIINGTRAVSADTALRLGHWFGTSADFWLRLQMIYDLRLAEQALVGTLSSLPRRIPVRA
jgi:antitoxin HigA-1